jgi:hypothetical protein
VRVHPFGDHLKRSAGTLVLVPNGSTADMNLVKGVLLRAAYGDGVIFERVDWSMVQVFLLPDGEEVGSAGEWSGWEGEGQLDVHLG